MLFSKKVTLALLLSGHTETTDYNIVGSSYCWNFGVFLIIQIIIFVLLELFKHLKQELWSYKCRWKNSFNLATSEKFP